jgi:ribosomal protein S18 acetylase RimI-like enzyme
MEFTIQYPTREDFLKMNEQALKEFGIPDENMVAPTLENDLSVQGLEKNNFICYKENGIPIAWSLVLPTSKEIKDKFLKEEINERQLFEVSIKNPSFESLYLFVVIVLPEYRQKGLAKELMSYQVKYFQDKYKITDFFAWIFSAEGEKLVKSLEGDNIIKIDYISRI